MPRNLNDLIAKLYSPAGEGGDPGGGGADESAGGGDSGNSSAGSDGDTEAEFQKQGGLTTIRKLRQELADAQRMIKTFQGRIDPDQFAKVKQEAEDLNRRVQEQESHLQLKLKEQEDSYASKLKEANDRVAALESSLDTVLRQNVARELWSHPDAGGLPDQFQAFWKLKGAEAMKRDQDGNLFVVDERGNPVLGEDGKRIEPLAWIKSLQADPILVHHFKPTVGSGSGSQGGRQAPRGSVKLMAESKGSLFDAFNED